MLTLGGHYGKVKGGYFGNGGHYGPKRADIMVWADTLVGADTMVHDKRLKIRENVHSHHRRVEKNCHFRQST